jgi:hypothetical protein
MELTARDRLRRDVRRVVHQTCLRHFERDAAGTPDLRDYALDAMEAARDAAAVSQADMQQWIAEDEADFERALLLSDLVARRISATTITAAPSATATTAVAPVQTASPAEEAAASRPVRSAPSITALLDDMFAQRAAPPRG